MHKYNKYIYTHAPTCTRAHTYTYTSSTFACKHIHTHTSSCLCNYTHDKLIHTKEWAYNSNTHNHDECILYMDIHKHTHKLIHSYTYKGTCANIHTQRKQ